MMTKIFLAVFGFVLYTNANVIPDPQAITVRAICNQLLQNKLLLIFFKFE